MGPTGMVGPIYLSSPLPGRMASSAPPICAAGPAEQAGPAGSAKGLISASCRGRRLQPL